MPLKYQPTRLPPMRVEDCMFPTASDDLGKDGVAPGAYSGGQICWIDLHGLCERAITLAIGSMA